MFFFRYEQTFLVENQLGFMVLSSNTEKYKIGMFAEFGKIASAKFRKNDSLNAEQILSVEARGFGAF